MPAVRVSTLDRIVGPRTGKVEIPITVALAAVELISRALTSYAVIGADPVEVGGVHLAVAVTAPPAAPAAAVPMTGLDVAEGLTGVMAVDRAENGPAPTPLMAATWNW